MSAEIRARREREDRQLKTGIAIINYAWIFFATLAFGGGPAIAFALLIGVIVAAITIPIAGSATIAAGFVKWGGVSLSAGLSVFLFLVLGLIIWTCVKIFRWVFPKENRDSTAHTWCEFHGCRH